MKKRIFRGTVGIGVFLLIGIIIGFSIFGFSMSNINKQSYSYEEDENSYSLISDEYIICVYADAWIDIEKLGYNNALEFLEYCAKCIEHLVERTNKTDWSDELTNTSEDGKAIIKICTVDDITSRVLFPEGNIYLNKDNIQMGMSDIEHELTHLVMGECEEGTLSEGFAAYMEHMEFGANNFSLYGLDIDVVIQNLYLAAQYEALTRDILSTVGAAYDSSIKHQQYGQIFYVYACSYVNYLVSTYGIEAVVEIFEVSGSESAYQTYIGKDMLSIKSEWLEYLKQYEGEMSAEEIIAYLSE